MTIDEIIKLSPLPEGYDKYSPPRFYDGQMFHEGQMRAYARANVANAVAPLQAEIEALRAEVERLRADRGSREQQPAAETVNVIGMPEFDHMLDHVYEHGTAAEGVIEKANAFARGEV